MRQAASAVGFSTWGGCWVHGCPALHVRPDIRDQGLSYRVGPQFNQGRLSVVQTKERTTLSNLGRTLPEQQSLTGSAQCLSPWRPLTKNDLGSDFRTLSVMFKIPVFF